MARVTITLEDVTGTGGQPGTKVVLDPPYEVLMQKAVAVATHSSSGSNAEALAMHAARAILDAQQGPGESLIIRVPGLGR